MKAGAKRVERTSFGAYLINYSHGRSNFLSGDRHMAGKNKLARHRLPHCIDLTSGGNARFSGGLKKECPTSE